MKIKNLSVFASLSYVRPRAFASLPRLVALIIGALVLSATAFPVVSAVTVTSFSDVGEWDTTFKAIDYLREEEVVVGYSDGTYGLDSNITNRFKENAKICVVV